MPTRLLHERRCTLGDHPLGHLTGFEPAEHDDATVRRRNPNQRQRLEPVHDRHGEVEQHGVRLMFAHEFQARPAVARLRHDVELPLPLKSDAEQQPDVRGVIDDDDTQWPGRRGAHGDSSIIAGSERSRIEPSRTWCGPSKSVIILPTAVMDESSAAIARSRSSSSKASFATTRPCNTVVVELEGVVLALAQVVEELGTAHQRGVRPPQRPVVDA